MPSSPDHIDNAVDDYTVTREEEVGKCRSFMMFLWNSEKGEFLGRTGGSWGRIGLFYLIFYALLGGYWYGLLRIFFLTMDENVPKYYSAASTNRGNPGLGFRPMRDIDTTTVAFDKSDSASYSMLLKDIKSFLQSYNSTNNINCTGKTRSTANAPCHFDVEKLIKSSPCNEANDYGFKTGTPCMVLKMNKIYDWVPQPYNSTDKLYTDGAKGLEARALNVMVQTVSNDHLGSIGVSCEGIVDSDKANLGSVKFYPPEGFSANFFPYMHQPGYQRPFVFAHFENVTNGVLLLVRCRLWAQNILNSEFNKREGAVHFELLVD